MARLGSDIQPPEFEGDWLERYNAERNWINDLINNGLDSEGYAGCVMRFQVADGYAFYLVQSEKPLVLRWIATDDLYQVADYVIRGLRLSDVKQSIDFDRQWFGKVRKES